MRTLLFASVCFTMWASTAAANIFSCKTLDAVQVGSDGKMSRSGYAAFLVENYGVFVFDDETGEYSRGSIKWNFEVLQKGSSENSMKAIRLHRGSVTAVIQRLEIKFFDQNQFSYIDSTEIRSGVCEVEFTKGDG